jgi:regulator of sigma E protease
MDFLLTAIAFIVIFSVLILVHECGHFFVAKKSGIKVEEFGFGLPPRIWGHRKGETIYSINAIPFGGFVRMLGEDDGDSKLEKNKRSFSSKPPRIRILVVIAGVTMNFLLAFVLLTVGFIFGMKPLILSGDDVLGYIDSGVIENTQGIVVKEVSAGGAADRSGLKVGDRIVDMNGREILEFNTLQSAIDTTVVGGNVILNVERAGAPMSLNLIADSNGLGFSPYEFVYLPRVAVEGVKAGSFAESAGIMQGDVFLKINGKSIYYMSDFEDAISSGGEFKAVVLRDYKEQEVTLGLGRKNLAIITGVFPNTPADTAGIEKGDVIVSINDTVLTGAREVVAFTSLHKDEILAYKIDRNGQVVNLNVKPGSDGLVGVALSTVSAYENSDLSVYVTDMPASVTKIQDVRYSVWEAPGKAFSDMVKLGYMTVGMFADVIKSVATKLTVPEGVSGPVGIAVLTYSSVQEGGLSLLRFGALLSLSLAIINIFPLPALDGGKLIFILLEIIIGRKISPKFEALVHTVGFILLLMLIMFITYGDVVRIFA